MSSWAGEILSQQMLRDVPVLTGVHQLSPLLSPFLGSSAGPWERFVMLYSSRVGFQAKINLTIVVFNPVPKKSWLVFIHF